MNKPHKHAEYIKAWADGARIQYRLDAESGWKDILSPSWAPDIEYRFKPDTIEYRVALLRNRSVNVITKHQHSQALLESDPDFVHWLTGWTEVEV